MSADPTDYPTIDLAQRLGMAYDDEGDPAIERDRAIVVGHVPACPTWCSTPGAHREWASGSITHELVAGDQILTGGDGRQERSRVVLEIYEALDARGRILRWPPTVEIQEYNADKSPTFSNIVQLFDRRGVRDLIAALERSLEFYVLPETVDAVEPAEAGR